MVCRIPLDIPDGHRLADFFSLAFQLTHMGTDVSQSTGERHLLTDNRSRLVVFPVFHMADIAWDVGMGRTCVTARNYRILFLYFRIDHLVADGSCGTDFCACAAEPAVRIL